MTRLFFAALFFMLPLLVDGSLRPVVIVPGTGGSQLQAKLNKPSVKHFYCSKTSDWYTLWLSVTQLLPPAINCWVDNIQLLFNNTTKTYTNNVGVETRVPGWGTTEAIEYLDPSIKVGQSAYFYPLVDALVKAGGTRNHSIRGAPYDFRRTPDSAYNGQYVTMLQALIEETYAINDNTAVTLLSHSMGCLYSLYFLNQMTQAWKDKYIHQWLPTSGVFAGAGEGVLQLISGSNEGIPGVSGLTVRGEQRSYQSSLWLLPTPSTFDTLSLVITPSRNYTAHDYTDLFARAKFPMGTERLALVANLTSELSPPNVLTTHLYGLGVETKTSFRWNTDSDFPDKQPDAINGDGDGTVPSLSLKSVERWELRMPGKFSSKVFNGQCHACILKDQDYINEVLALLSL